MYVVGDFNGWDTTKTPLSATPNGGVWTVTLPLSAGRHIYAFVVDGSWSADPACTPRARRRVRPCEFRQARPRRIVVVTHGSLQRSLRILPESARCCCSRARCPLAAQEPDPLAKLETKDRFAIELMIDSANMAGLPSNPLRLDGAAGHRQARRRSADRRGGSKAARYPPDGARCARPRRRTRIRRRRGGAQRRRKAGAARGVPRRGKKGRSDLQAFVVWADFLQRSVPNEEAFTAITKLWQDGADDDTFHSLWTNVQCGYLSRVESRHCVAEPDSRDSRTRFASKPVKPPEGAAGEPKLEMI